MIISRFTIFTEDSLFKSPKFSARNITVNASSAHKDDPFRTDVQRSTPRIPSMLHHAEKTGAMVDGSELWVEERSASPGHVHDCPQWIITQGASKLSTAETVERQSRSPPMAALISEADAKSASKPIHHTLPWWETKCREKFDVWISRECEWEKLDTQDRSFFKETRMVMLLSLRVMMPLLLKISGEMWSHAWQDPYLCQTSFRKSQIPWLLDPVPSRFHRACEYGVARKVWGSLPPASLSPSLLPTHKNEDESAMFDAQVSLAPNRSNNGRVAFLAELIFRLLRLVSPGERVFHASGSVGGVDESIQDAAQLCLSDSVGTKWMKRALGNLGSSGDENRQHWWLGEISWKRWRNGWHSGVEGSGGDRFFQEQQLSEKVLKALDRWTHGDRSRTGFDLQERAKIPPRSFPERIEVCSWRNLLVGGVAPKTSLEAFHIASQDAPPSASWRTPSASWRRAHAHVEIARAVWSFQKKREFNVLLMSNEAWDEKAAVSRRRRHRTGGLDLEKRALKAETLIQMGELSSARQALEGTDLAKGESPHTTIADGRDRTVSATVPAHKLWQIPKNCQCKWLLASYSAPRTFANCSVFPEKFLFCTDTAGSIRWPSLAPRLHIDDSFEIHTFTDNFVICCDQVTKNSAREVRLCQYVFWTGRLWFWTSGRSRTFRAFGKWVLTLRFPKSAHLQDWGSKGFMWRTRVGVSAFWNSVIHKIFLNSCSHSGLSEWQWSPRTCS